MKKTLAIIFAFFIAFAPVYSNAVLPALAATAASSGGRVLVGQTIKKVAPSAIANAQKAAVGICKSNPKACTALGTGATGLIGALIGGNWNIEVTNNDVTNNIDVDIYKINQSDTCYIQVGFGENQDSADVSYNKIMQRSQDSSTWMIFSRNPDSMGIYNKISADGQLVDKKTLTQQWQPFRIGFEITFKASYVDSKGQTQQLANFASGDSAYIRCLTWNGDNKTYITNNELNNYINNNQLDGDDILNIYNYDYSQHPTINIAGNEYNGTTVNNDLAKSDPSEADKKVTPDIKQKVDSGQLSLDDINDQNCTKNEAGEYDKCDGNTDPEPDPTDPEPEPPKEPPPIECDANGFYKKVCDWMDWTQTKHDKPESGKVDIIDKSDGLNIDKNRIDFSNQCPAPTPIDTSVGGFPVSTELNYQPLCDFFTMLNPFVIGMGGISSALIIAGGVRRG